MLAIGTINWKNTAENLIIIIATLFVGAFIGYKASTLTNEKVLEQLIPTIERAIDKETIKNEIKNEIDIDIDKIKKSDSLKIHINQIPENKQKPTNVIVQTKDSVVKKKGLFKRLFTGTD